MALTAEQQELRATVRDIVDREIAPGAAEIDSTRSYPSQNLRSLAQAGLMGLLVPTGAGGRGGSLTDLAVATSELGRGCASTAMCFLMHCCGVAVIAAKASAEQTERWLRPAAAGSGLATLAFSERGTGAHFYQPELVAARQNGGFSISGTKSFVTSGGQAQLYPVLVNAPDGAGLDIYVVPSTAQGVTFSGEWRGLGITGNSSIAMTLNDAHVSESDRLGQAGDGQELVFNVVAPTFLIGLAAVHVGIAQAALDAALDHAKNRSYPGGQSLAQLPIIQNYIAEMSTGTEAARQLVFAASNVADSADPATLVLVMEAKLEATEAAKRVTALAMEIGGGQAYGRLLPIERHWRDAQAGSVMAPTNEVLREWLGKALAGLPLF